MSLADETCVLEFWTDDFIGRLDSEQGGVCYVQRLIVDHLM